MIWKSSLLVGKKHFTDHSIAAVTSTSTCQSGCYVTELVAQLNRYSLSIISLPCHQFPIFFLYWYVVQQVTFHKLNPYISFPLFSSLMIILLDTSWDWPMQFSDVNFRNNFKIFLKISSCHHSSSIYYAITTEHKLPFYYLPSMYN